MHRHAVTIKFLNFKFIYFMSKLQLLTVAEQEKWKINYSSYRKQDVDSLNEDIANIDIPIHRDKNTWINYCYQTFENKLSNIFDTCTFKNHVQETKTGILNEEGIAESNIHEKYTMFVCTQTSFWRTIIPYSSKQSQNILLENNDVSKNVAEAFKYFVNIPKNMKKIINFDKHTENLR